MPSPELLAFNADARTRKPFVSSNYDPRVVRERMRAPPELERTSTFADCDEAPHVYPLLAPLPEAQVARNALREFFNEA